MSLMRSDLQIALNDLYTLAQASGEQYQNLADFIEDQAIGQLLLTIADRRLALAEDLEAAIRQTDDLPTAPDSDRETSLQLMHRLRAFLSADQSQDILKQRLMAEQELLEQLVQVAQSPSAEHAGLDASYQGLLARFNLHVRETKQELRQHIDAGAA